MLSLCVCVYVCRYTFICGDMCVEELLGVIPQILSLVFFRQPLTGLELITQSRLSGW